MNLTIHAWILTSIENARTSHSAFRGPSGPKSRSGFGAAKKSEKSQKRVNNESKRPRFDSFGPFLTLWPEGPERLFSDFFVTLGPKGPKGSVARPLVLNMSTAFSSLTEVVLNRLGTVMVRVWFGNYFFACVLA